MVSGCGLDLGVYRLTLCWTSRRRSPWVTSARPGRRTRRLRRAGWRRRSRWGRETSAEGIFEHDGLGATRADRDQRRRHADQVLDAADVFLRRLRQRLEVAHLAGVGVPAVERF